MALEAVRELRRVGVDTMEPPWCPDLSRPLLSAAVLRAKAVSGAPDPKSRSLARGERRTSRIVAGKDEWARIAAAKQGPCRVCVRPKSNGSYWGEIELHHIVSRARGGDDIEDNVAPLCNHCHGLVTAYKQPALSKLGASLTESERAYVVGKLGESGPERLFKVGR